MAVAGLTAVITGGASGIGSACASAFMTGGARVAILDLADPGAGPATAGSAHGSAPEGGHQLRFRADVADGQSLQDAMDTVAATYGGIDILVNSAGVSAVGDVAANDDAEWTRVLDINVTGIARASRAALPYLRLSAHPAIVNLSSIAATAGLVQRALYSASKGAVHALTLAMAADFVAEGIRVNCVAPGTVDTPWVARLLAQSADPGTEKARLAARQPTGRLVTAEEVAAAVLYLAGPSAGATTGVSLAVDGGMSGLRLPSA